MEIDVRTPENTAIILIDYVSGFAPLIASQTIAENTAGGRALAQTAKAFEVPLIVSVGPERDPRGVLYPEIAEVLAGGPPQHRGLTFDAFEDEEFATAVHATGRRHLVVAGLMTDGCITHTVMSALRRGHEVSIVADATASTSLTAHETAMARFGQLGVTPRTWMSLASEFQKSYANTETLSAYREIQANLPGYAMLNATLGNARKIATV
ncbi:isochorismatase family protein [Nocardia araoensis]|uniref:isochorismatase family protein n=1 Tax=Nocardia araoensis TaxID=228600 RepID=UPI0002FD3CD1|nr:isochorismatase family protein [Nocardia araoensis]